MGQARTLLSLKDKSKLVALARRVVDQNLTVRQLEQLVSQMNGNGKKTTKKPVKKSVYLKEAESSLQSHFGTKVTVAQSNTKDGAGKIEIPYLSDEDLTRILEILNINLD